MRNDGLSLVLMKSGKVIRTYVQIVVGACIAGEPTAYINYLGDWVAVKPGESVEFIEA